MKASQAENRKLCGSCYCTDYLDYIYVNEIGEIIKPGYLSAHFVAVLEEHNMPHIRFHDLRHPYVKHTTKNILHKQKYQTTNGFDGMGFPHLYNLYRFSENQLIYEVSLQFYYFCTNILSTCAINLLCKLRAGDGSFAYFKHVIANEGFSLFLMYYLSSGRTATDYRDSL